MDAITLADKTVKRVQRYARQVRDQGSRAMSKLDESLRDLVRQLDVIHDETVRIPTPAGAISAYGQTRVAEADRALGDLRTFVRDPVAFARRNRVDYGHERGSADDVAIRAHQLAATAFQGVRAARTIVIGASRRDPRRGSRHRRDPRLDKKVLWRTIDQDLRKKNREKLAHLKSEVARAREDRRAARERAREKCDYDRRRARREAERLRQRARAKLDHARQSCALGKAFVRDARAAVTGARTTLERERAHQREMRQIERSAKARAARALNLAKTRGERARERAGESDDEVRQNIDPSLHALFERVKRTIRATPRMSRTEAFTKYVEEHPREADEAIEDQTEALIRQLEARQRTG